MKRSVRRFRGLVELFCVRVNRSRRPGRLGAGLECSGAEHDLANGEHGPGCGCERETARMLRQGREQYGDLDEVEEPGAGSGGGRR